jgi:chromosome segregation ATPase
MAGQAAVVGTGEGRGCKLTSLQAAQLGLQAPGPASMRAEAETMKASKMLDYLDDQERALEALVEQLDEIQVAFNAQFDRFKAQHDAALDRLTDQVAGRLDEVDSDLRAAVERRLPEEQRLIDERRQKVRQEYLPRRQEAADALLNQAQAQLAELRALNPRLDAQEEEIKRQKATLEAQLGELNEEIRAKSRGFGVIWHFIAITRADRERQRIVGKLEVINNSLFQVRREWEDKYEETRTSQDTLQAQWQLESVAVARLQSELDQLDDESRRGELALRRSIRHVLDALKEPASSSAPKLEAGLREMIELNVQTDAYHEALASVGGFIGLLRGISSGLQAIRKSIDGLRQEQEMHGAYLKALDFSLPAGVEAFHRQWPELARQFADEKAIGAQPADFAAAVEPLLEGPLSQASIEAMFNDLGVMIERATAAW